jgi:putative FmdB family regulatory protein
MPIYAYRCASCGHAKDVLQKISDAALTTCPACGASEFAKQLTAAGFQLKGSGWYATDFKGGAAKKPAESDKAVTTAANDKPGDAPKSGEAGDAAGNATKAEPKSAAAGCGSGCACH